MIRMDGSQPRQQGARSRIITSPFSESKRNFDIPPTVLIPWLSSRACRPPLNPVTPLFSGGMLGALHPAELQSCHISRLSWFKRAPAGRARAAGRRWQVPRAEHQEAPAKAGRDALAGLDAGALCLEIEPGSNNSRCIYASTDVPAPKETLWRLLTDYQHLNDFIPGALLWEPLARPALGPVASLAI